MVRNPVRPVGIGDVSLDHNQLRCIVVCERFHMFAHENGAIIGR